MKNTLILAFATLCISLPLAAEDVEFPSEGPLITLSIPDDWKHEEVDGILQAVAGDDMETMFSLKPLQATKKEGSAAIAEIKEPLDKMYEGEITYDEMVESGVPDGNMNLYTINAEAKLHSADQGEVTSFVNSIMISFPDTDELLLAQFISTKAGFRANAEGIKEIVGSLKKAE